MWEVRERSDGRDRLVSLEIQVLLVPLALVDREAVTDGLDHRATRDLQVQRELPGRRDLPDSQVTLVLLGIADQMVVVDQSELVVREDSRAWQAASEFLDLPDSLERLVRPVLSDNQDLMVHWVQLGNLVREVPMVLKVRLVSLDFPVRMEIQDSKVIPAGRGCLANRATLDTPA